MLYLLRKYQPIYLTSVFTDSYGYLSILVREKVCTTVGCAYQNVLEIVFSSSFLAIYGVLI